MFGTQQNAYPVHGGPGYQHQQQAGGWRPPANRRSASDCCGCDCSSCCRCLDCDDCCDCQGVLCCRTPYGKHGWRLNLAWAFGCISVLLLSAAIYCSLIAGDGKLPNVADPDAWTDGWGLVLPILIVTAVIILPFSIMYCVLFDKRAKVEERRARAELPPQMSTERRTSYDDDDDPPVLAASFLTLSFVLGVVGMIVYALGFGRINSKMYEGAKVAGLFMIVVACFMLPISSIFVVVSGRERLRRFRGGPAYHSTYYQEPPVQNMNRGHQPAGQGHGYTKQQASPPCPPPPPSNPQPRVSFPNSDEGATKAHRETEQPYRPPPPPPPQAPQYQAPPPQYQATDPRALPPNANRSEPSQQQSGGLFDGVKKGLGKGLTALGAQLKK